MKKLVFIFIFLIFNFVSASLEITEIMYNPEGNDSGREWIEVKNISNQTITIIAGKSGWRINDGSNHLFEESLTINPGEIFVVIQERNLFLKDYPNFSGKSILANFSLKNESGQIQIFDQNKNLITNISYQSSCGGNGNGYSIVFQNGQCFENKIKGGTPGSINQNETQILLQSEQPATSSQQLNIFQTFTLQSTSSQEEFSKNQNNPISVINNKLDLPTSSKAKEIKTTLIVSEFYPNPEGNDEGKEFIEIYNYGNEEIDLDGFTLKIGDKEIKLKGRIEPKEYWLITNKEYNFYIRNKGDTLALYYDKEKIFEISYSGKAEEGKSYSRDNNGKWFFTKPTPGTENEFSLGLKEKPSPQEIKEEIVFNQQDFLKGQAERNIKSQNNYFYLILSLIVIFILVFLVWLKL